MKYEWSYNWRMVTDGWGKGTGIGIRPTWDLSNFSAVGGREWVLIDGELSHCSHLYVDCSEPCTAAAAAATITRTAGKLTHGARQHGSVSSWRDISNYDYQRHDQCSRDRAFASPPQPLRNHHRCSRGKSGPALGGTEYRLMPSACRLIVPAKLWNLQFRYLVSRAPMRTLGIVVV